MKKWICFILFVCFLAGCSAVPSLADPAQELSCTTVSDIACTDLTNSTTFETQPITITTTKKDGTVDTAQLSAGTDEYELLMQIYTEGQLVRYPRVEQQPDGTFEVVTVEMSIPKNPQQDPTYTNVVRGPDGTLRVVIMDAAGRPIPQRKTATKTTRFFSADGTLQWTMSVTATFTYDGLCVSCSDIITDISIENKDAWCVINETASETVPSLDVTFGRITLGVITSMPEFSLALECDYLGNLS